MDSLDASDWDTVIVGTGLKPSLLALALSRSGSRVLHLDRNGYYGGNEAALSLSEAEEWATAHSQPSEDTTTQAATPPSFSNAKVTAPSGNASEGASKKTALGPPRSYALALAPQLIYARSNLLPTLVSSRTHNQLEFQAVGSWFVVGGEASPKLSRVPGGREDIFQDSAIDLRAKRSLMKFLRFVGNYEEKEEQWTPWKDMSFPDCLEKNFGLPPASHGPLLALTLSASEPAATTVAEVLPRIARHLRSIGVFGAGFGAVFPKWGGLAEVAQVACRACAVGGGVYVLGTDIASVRKTEDGSLAMDLDGGEKITTKHLVGSHGDLPSSVQSPTKKVAQTLARSVTIVSSALASLFPPTSEGGVTPAAAVVVVPSATQPPGPPVHILAHSTESGECPTGQCVLYALTKSLDGPEALKRLDSAVSSLLQSVAPESDTPEVLWQLSYLQTLTEYGSSGSEDSNIIGLQPMSLDLALDDSALDDVKSAWLQLNKDSQETFMKFEAREGVDEDEVM